MNRNQGPATGAPSASGVRRGGDDFQDLVAWSAALRLVAPRPEYNLVEVEQTGVGNLDDVILRTVDAALVGDRFIQVKWATKESMLVDEDFLTDVAKAGARSLLRKLYDSYLALRAKEVQGQFSMELFTNRTLDRDHPLLAIVDGRTGLLMPAAGTATPRTNVGKAVNAWASHLDVDRDEVLEMLTMLRFRTGRDVFGERENVKTQMLAVGLHTDDDALDRALDMAGSWVTDGRRELNPAEVNSVIDDLDLRAGPPTATLLIDGIDHDPNPEAATVHLDWVARYAESSPALRRAPEEGAWGDAQADLDRAGLEIEAAGLRRVYLRGYFRQATAFAAGARLARARGFDLDYRQGGQTWSTDAPGTAAGTGIEVVELGEGPDVAVVVGVAADATADVRDFLSGTGARVGRLVVCQPEAGADDEAVAGAGHAVGIAREVRSALRGLLADDPDVERFHLFMAGPNGLAVVLGHRWNGLRPTVVYEHLGVGRGYTPAFHTDS